MAAGVVLILSALFLTCCNWLEDHRAGKTSVNILQDLYSVIPEQGMAGPGEHINPFDEQAVEEACEMTVTEIDGYGYIGCLSVPALELELPVMSEWDYPRLKIAPCRQFGTTKGRDLVIAGHNYSKHFGRLSSLKLGDEVWFTDMDGGVTGYQVGTVNVISPQATEEVKNSEWDLVLYTCSYGGQSRVMVGCVHI